jgi:SPP1 gp7 family putative phage head morphogenesis protein
MKRREKSPFDKARSIEEGYARDLRKIAREIGRIVSGYDASDPYQQAAMAEALRKYADLIKPWAQSKALTMIARINEQDARAWRKATSEVSSALRQEIAAAPTGMAMRTLLGEQVELITSLPIKAAERVQHFAQEARITGSRSKEFVAEIMRSGEVSKARATMIARTETARAASVLTQARAEHIGSDGYIWRTSRDGDVRPSHKKMEGRFVSWTSPPTLDNLTGHAGCLPNCRCYCEPVIPKHLE